MQRIKVGSLCVAGLLLIAWVAGADYVAVPPAQPPATGTIIPLSVALPNNRQQVTLIDTQGRVMSVYHIDGETGEVSLRCVRNFQWDLHLSEFNGANPLPREIRAMIEQR